MIDRWFIQFLSEYFLKVPALFPVFPEMILQMIVFNKQTGALVYVLQESQKYFSKPGQTLCACF